MILSEKPPTTMKISAGLPAHAMKSGVFLFAFCTFFFGSVNAQNCSNFKISLESHSYLFGKTLFIWSIKNLKPGKTSTNSLTSWGISVNGCVKSKNILSCGFSHSTGSWTNFLPLYTNGKNDNCINAPAIVFNYGTVGKAPSYYILVLKGNYTTSRSDAFLKSGKSCCIQSIDGIGCDCSTVGAPSAEDAARCGAGEVTLKAAGCSNGTLNWYIEQSGGLPIASGPTFHTVVNSNTTYYVSCTKGSCESPRAAVTAIVNSQPDVPIVIGGSRCGTGTVSLSAFGCAGGSLQWYDSYGSADPVSYGATYQPYLFYNSSPLYNTNHNSYFVSCTVNGCESDKAEVVADVQFPGMVPANVSDISRCGPGQLTLTASCPNGTSPGWFEDLTSPPIGFGTSFTTYIENTTTYYVSCPGCGNSTGKIPVTASIESCNTAGRSAILPDDKVPDGGSELFISASPNPYASTVRFVIRSANAGQAVLDIFNMTGQKIKTVYNGQLSNGKEQTVDYAIPETFRSNLIYKLKVGTAVKSGILICGK